MIKEAGADYAIVGHSERRRLFGETDAIVNRKTMAAIGAGLTPIVCVGETLEERERERDARGARPADQARPGRLTADQVAALVVAYEPVWAIGTGRKATAAQAGEAHAHIRKRLRQWFGADAADACHILYGGSVKPDNIRELIAEARRRRRPGRRREPRRAELCRDRHAQPTACGIIAVCCWKRFAVHEGRESCVLMIAYYALSTFYVVICLILLLVILLQQGKGDMAAAFGGGSSQSAFGARTRSDGAVEGHGDPGGAFHARRDGPLHRRSRRFGIGGQRHSGTCTRRGAQGAADDAGTGANRLCSVSADRSEATDAAQVSSTTTRPSYAEVAERQTHQLEGFI